MIRFYATFNQEHPFWNFSCQLYAKPQVKTASLGLQEHYGLNVNILLFCLWCAKAHHILIPAEIARGITRVAAWQEIAKNIRLYRINSQHNKRLYRVLLKTELHAEYQQQILLANSLTIKANSEQSKLTIATLNLANYCSLQKLDLDELAQEYLKIISASAKE